MSFLQEMWRSQLEPNAISYGAAISACEKGKHWEQALILLPDRLRSWLEPNVISYNALISACEKCQHWEQALSFVAGNVALSTA